MKLLLVLLVSTAALISVEGKIPDYIHVCKRNDPQLSKCVENSILSMLDRLAAGIPELDVPSLDPLYLDKLSLKLGPELKAEARNLKLTGGKKVQINDIDIDVDADTIKLKISFPEVTVRGEYTVEGKLGSLPLKGTGPLSLLAKSVIGQGTLHGKKLRRGGKTLYYFSSMDLKIRIGDYEIRLDNLFQGDPTIGEATNRVLNTEKAEVLGAFIPELEKTVIDLVLTAGNNVVKHFTYDELLPTS